MKKGLAIFAFLLVLGAWSPTFAYVLWGYKWASPNITYECDMHGDYTTQCNNGKTEWSNWTDVNLSYSSNPGITTTAGNYGNVSWSGLCSVGSSSGSTVYRMDISINTYYTDSYSSQKRKGVITHELGHALGLSHENRLGPGGAVMYDNDGRTVYSPTQDDINGVNAIY
ncbi:M57 family metalloprotease [Laceyella tengchongensis]|uniref:M57 family metalloprotease n=1 Tax=Laceyella tengchongensis TaxID=574699 RepID=UPI0012B8788E|nr:matrixin family metalloprotease [Laceyella tengchongensis]